MFPYLTIDWQSCSAKSAIRSKFVADTYTTIRACTVQEWREKEGDAAKISLTFILGYHWSRACH